MNPLGPTLPRTPLHLTDAQKNVLSDLHIAMATDGPRRLREAQGRACAPGDDVSADVLRHLAASLTSHLAAITTSPPYGRMRGPEITADALEEAAVILGAIALQLLALNRLEVS